MLIQTSIKRTLTTSLIKGNVFGSIEDIVKKGEMFAAQKAIKAIDNSPTKVSQFCDAKKVMEIVNKLPPKTSWYSSQEQEHDGNKKSYVTLVFCSDK